MPQGDVPVREISAELPDPEEPEMSVAFSSRIKLPVPEVPLSTANLRSEIIFPDLRTHSEALIGDKINAESASPIAIFNLIGVAIWLVAFDGKSIWELIL